MAQIFQAPLAREFSNTGSIGAGYKYYFYTTGTTTPISTYTTPALSVANAYPVVADSTGRFPPIWISSLATTKVILKDAVDNIIYTQDPVGNSGNNTSLNDLDVRPNSYWGLTTGTSTAYVLTANPSISAYNNTQSFTFQAHIANGVSPTIAISGLAALNLKKYTGQGTKVALQVGDLQATQRYNALCDGTDVVVLNPNIPYFLNPTLIRENTSTEGGQLYYQLPDINDLVYTDILKNGARYEYRYVSNINSITTVPFTISNNANGTLYQIIDSLGASLTASGYKVLNNGLIIQWGTTGNVATDGSTTVTFPTSFPTACLNVSCTAKASGAGVDNYGLVISFSTSQTIIARGGAGGTPETNTLSWFAIGN